MMGRRPPPPGEQKGPGCASTQPMWAARSRRPRALAGASLGPGPPPVRPEGTRVLRAQVSPLSTSLSSSCPRPPTGTRIWAAEPEVRGSAAAWPWGAGVRLGGLCAARVRLAAGRRGCRSGREAGQKPVWGAPLRLGETPPHAPGYGPFVFVYPWFTSWGLSGAVSQATLFPRSLTRGARAGPRRVLGGDPCVPWGVVTFLGRVKGHRKKRESLHGSRVGATSASRREATPKVSCRLGLGRAPPRLLAWDRVRPNPSPREDRTRFVHTDGE